MEFLRRSIVETNRANRLFLMGIMEIASKVEKRSSLWERTHILSLSLSLLVLNKMRIFIPSRSKQDWDWSFLLCYRALET